MLDWIQNLMNSLGYLGIALLMFLENVFPPIPSELVMPLAGFASTQGQLSFLGVVIAGVIGAVLGQLPLYYLAKFVGKKRLMTWADKYGKWLAISSEEIERADRWFGRYGGSVVFFGRLVPGIRSLISVPAGFTEMNLTKFLLYSSLGISIWSAVLAYLGRLLGENYQAISRFLGPVTYIVLGALVAAAIVWVVKRKCLEGEDKKS